MTTPLTLLTGASRGLGLAIAEQLLSRGERVLAISRGAVAASGPGELIAWSADLADPAPVAARLESWLATQAPTTVTLIHNAGVTATPAPLSRLPSAELSNLLRVDLEAPLLLTAAFLRATAAWSQSRKVLLISSGAGRRAMASSVAYCAAKAGLDHLARALALDEAKQPNGARVVSLAPGVIDTGMQQLLRDADPALFPDREYFLALKSSGQLDTPAQAAAKVLRVLARPDFGDLPVTDVRESA